MTAALAEHFSVKIKTSDVKDIELTVSTTDTVHDLRRLIKKRLDINEGQPKNIRLVSSGKLLDPPTRLLVDFNIGAGAFIHAVITNAIVSSRNSSENSFRVDESMHSAGEANSVNLGNLHGLDRLLSDGLNVDEVAAIRSSFRESIDELAVSIVPLEGEDPIHYRGRVEDEWMASQGQMSEFALNLPNSSRLQNPNVTVLQMAMSRNFVPDDDQGLGTYFDFVWGFITGFMLGFIMIFCIWDRNVTHRQKVGILFGIICQLLIGLAQGDVNDRRDRSHSSSVMTRVDAPPVQSSMQVPSDMGIGDRAIGLLQSPSLRGPTNP